VAVAQPTDMLSVVVRVHDYAGIAPRCMMSAQTHVNSVYAAIGVRTIWTETRNPNQSPGRATKYAPGQLLINIVTPEMSRRMAIAEDALGMAAVTPSSGGTIAYLLFDRIRDVARSAGRDLADILGFVIAHEIGHLLLPSGSHSPSGVMRPTWRPADFTFDAQPPQTFTSEQADGIRALLRASSIQTSLRAQIAGQ